MAKENHRLVMEASGQMAINENAALAAQEEEAWDAMYDRALTHYKRSGHYAEDVAEEIDEAIEKFKEDSLKARRPDFERVFIIDRSVKIEETRYAEFKEVTANNPVSSIVNVADVYAVAFLNREGGSIFWGIRNADRVVVGVRLNYEQMDKIRRLVSEKFAGIQPPPPISLLGIEIYPVLNEHGDEIEDLWVLEAFIPAGWVTELYATQSEKVFIKTDGGKQYLNFRQSLAEYVKRNNIQPKETNSFASMKTVSVQRNYEPYPISFVGPRSIECKKCGEIFRVMLSGYTIRTGVASDTVTCPGCGSTKSIDSWLAP
jgi:hypothetical protein